VVVVQICYTNQKIEDSEKANRKAGKVKAKIGRKKPAASTVDRENSEQQSETEHGEEARATKARKRGGGCGNKSVRKPSRHLILPRHNF